MNLNTLPAHLVLGFLVFFSEKRGCDVFLHVRDHRLLTRYYLEFEIPGCEHISGVTK